MIIDLNFDEVLSLFMRLNKKELAGSANEPILIKFQIECQDTKISSFLKKRLSSAAAASGLSDAWHTFVIISVP